MACHPKLAKPDGVDKRSMVQEGGLEPPSSYRGLAPKASASTSFATLAEIFGDLLKEEI